MRALFLIFVIFTFSSPAVALTKAQFERVIASVKKDKKTGEFKHPYDEALGYAYMLENLELTPEQRAKTLYASALVRQGQGHHLLGAARDYKLLMDQFPNSPLAVRAADDYAYVQGQIYHTIGRITNSESLHHTEVKALWDLGYWGLAASVEREIDYAKSATPPKLSSVYVNAMYKVGYLCLEDDRNVPARFYYGYKETEKRFNYCPLDTEWRYEQPQSFKSADRQAELIALQKIADAARKKG